MASYPTARLNPDSGYGHRLAVLRGETNVQALVRADLIRREHFGTEKYGRPMGPFDGRDSMLDLYEELLDAVVYLRKIMLERELTLASVGTSTDKALASEAAQQ